MQLDFKVEEQNLHLVSLKKVVADSVNYLTCKFTFSEDWSGVEKSATFFPVNGEPYTQVLEDDGCVVPHEVIKTPLFKVSVFGGDLITTNKVIVGVVESGYVIGETPKPPTPDVYSQILNKVSESEKNTEDALKTVEKKVEEVDEALEEVEEAIAGTQIAIDEVNNAKNMAIDVSDRAEIAIENTYIAIENAEKATEDAQKSTEGVEAVIENAENVIAEAETVIQQTKDTLSEGVANALKGTTSGETIGITDISPIEHNMGVSVRKKNLIPNVYKSITTNGVTFTVEEDGSIVANGTSTKAFSYVFIQTNQPIKLIANKNYVFSGSPSGSSYSTYYMAVQSTDYTKTYNDVGKGIVFTSTGKSVYAYISIQANITLNNVVFKPMLEEGTTATSYAPYIEDISTVKLFKSGKNLIPYPYANKTQTKNGITFNVNEDGTIIANGTATALTQFNLYVGENLLLPNVNYTISGCSGGSNATYDLRVTDNKTQAYACFSSPISFSYADMSRFTVSIKVSSGVTLNNVVFKPQISIGTDTEYETYIEPTVYDVQSDGTVEGVKSIYPSTTLYTDTQGAVIDCTYNRDINKAFAELQNAIIAIGGLE